MKFNSITFSKTWYNTCRQGVLMIKYKQYLKEAFENPKLNNNDNSNIISRAASPLELFFDLIFVLILANIGHILYEPTFENISLSIALYLNIYFFWTNITMYFIRFYEATYSLRFGLIIVMIPLLFYAIIDDFSSQSSIIFIAIGFILSRIALISLWHFTVFQNKKITNEVFKKSVLIDLKAFSFSSFFMVLPLIYPRSLILIICLIAAIIFEYMFIFISYRENNTILEHEKMPQIDFTLLKERHILFIILIFGEGLVSTINTFNNDIPIYLSSINTILLFFIVILFFTRVYEEFLLMPYNNIPNNFAMLNHLTFSFSLLFLFSVLGAITTQGTEVLLIYRVIIFFFLMYLTTWHIIANKYDGHFLKKTNSIPHFVSISHIQFLKVDNITLYLMYLVSFVILLVQNTTLVLLLILIYFALHVLPMPYRYQMYKVKLYEEINFDMDVT